MSKHRMIRSWESFSLRELVEEVAVSLASRWMAQRVDLVLDVPAEHRMTADRELLRRAVENLMLNALDAMPHGGLLQATSAIGPNAIELEIADSGPTMSDQQRQHILELMPADARGDGGWGLAMVRRIAELHGGGVLVANCPEGGAAVTLQIPRPAALEAAA